MRYLPGRKELLIFAMLAVVCATIVYAMPSRDLATSATAFPVFIGISIFSLWKHGRLGGTSAAGSERTED